MVIAPTYIACKIGFETKRYMIKKFNYKHHQVSRTLDATTILVFMVCTNLIFLLPIYLYIGNNNNNNNNLKLFIFTSNISYCNSN